MSRTYITYRLEVEEEGLACVAQDSEFPAEDFIIAWPPSLEGLEEPDYSEVKDLLVEGILAELNDRGLILTGHFAELAHAVYVRIAPGGPVVHPATFEVYEADSLRPEPKDSDHPMYETLMSTLAFSEKTGYGFAAREASHFAPEADRAEDHVIIILRGEQARQARPVLSALVDLLNER